MTRPPLLRRLTLRKGREPIRGEGGRLGASDVPLAAPHLFDAKNPTGPSPAENARGSDERARRAQWRGGRSARNVSVTLNPSSRSYSWKRLRPSLIQRHFASLRGTEAQTALAAGSITGVAGGTLRGRRSRSATRYRRGWRRVHHARAAGRSSRGTRRGARQLGADSGTGAELQEPSAPFLALLALPSLGVGMHPRKPVARAWQRLASLPVLYVPGRPPLSA